MGLAFNSFGNMGVVRGQSVPFGRARTPRSSELRFVMGDQGRATSQGQQDLIDLDGDEHPYGRQP